MDHQQNRRPSATISQQFQPVLYPKKSTGTYIRLTVYSMSQPIVLVAPRDYKYGLVHVLYQTRWVDISIIIIYLAPGQAPTEDCSHYLPGFCYIPWYSQCSCISFVIHACARDKTWPLFVFWSSHHHDRDSKVNIRRKIKPFQNGGITFPLFGKANQKPWSNHFIHSYMISVGLYLNEKNNRSCSTNLPHDIQT
jgi:hypothetical protein